MTATAYPAEAYAVKRSLGRCWGFSALSYGAWTYWWFYVHRRLLDAELGAGRDDAVLHTLGLVVPILNLVIVYWLWRDLNDLRVRVGLRPFPVGGYVAGAIFLAPVFYSLALLRLNEYWDARLGPWAAAAPVTAVEKILIGIGIGLWGLWALTLILVIVVFASSA